MNEYWVNVYLIGKEIWYGPKHYDKPRAIFGVGNLKNKLIYRIHVRLK